MAALCVSSCAERSLAPGAPDLATSAVAPVDFAVANDLAHPPGFGIVCNGNLCGGFETPCCTVDGALACATVDVCESDESEYFCDGPEDCLAGQICVAVSSGDENGPIFLTECIAPDGFEPSQQMYVVCHTTADCTSDPGARSCSFTEGFFGEVSISTCKSE